MEMRCLETSDVNLGRKVNWSPDGKSLLVYGEERDASAFGMVRFRSRRAFSADPGDWRSQGIVTETDEPGAGVIDAALSADGKQLAVVRRAPNGKTNLFIAKPDDLGLADAKALGVRACKVIWRPDGRQLVVVRNDDCGSETGELLRLAVADPKRRFTLGLNGDNPAFQPLSPG
jgi:hypothetical protein